MEGSVPNTAARRSLAARIGLPNHDGMQDWEYEVADAALFPKFLEAYRQSDLNVPERISLMEMLVQCVEDLLSADATRPSESLPEWQTVTGLLLEQPNLYAATINYWSCLEEPDPGMCFAVSTPMRALRADLRRLTF